MKRALAPLAAAILLLPALALGDKLAPPQTALQPIPAQIAPDLSQNVDRAETPQDEQTIEISQQQESSNPANSGSSAPRSFTAAEIALLIAALALAAAGIGQWVRSLGQ